MTVTTLGPRNVGDTAHRRVQISIAIEIARIHAVRLFHVFYFHVRAREIPFPIAKIEYDEIVIGGVD